MVTDTEQLAMERRMHSEERHTDIMCAIKGIHDRLDVLNGRTRATELEVAVIKDRAARVAAVYVSLGSILAVGVAYALRT